MRHFVVVNGQGPAWDSKRSIREQKGWDDHALFMDELENERLVVLSRPIRSQPKQMATLIVRAADEETVRRRLAEDQWMRTEMLRIGQIYPWEMLLGKIA